MVGSVSNNSGGLPPIAGLEQNYVKDSNGNIIGYKIGSYTLMVPDGMTGDEARDYIEGILQFISAVTHVPIDEIQNLRPHQFAAINWPGSSATGPLYFTSPTTSAGIINGVRLSAAGQTAINAFNNGEYFGNDIPYFPDGSELYLNHAKRPGSLSTYLNGLSGEALSIALGGIAGTAQALYNTNYPAGSNPTPLTNPDPQTLQLLQRMFGAETTFTLGHLNVLKMMGLVSGSAGASPSTWTLTTDGQTLLNKFNGNTSAAFVPQMSLLKAQVQTSSNRADGLFLAAGGYVQGRSASDVETLADEIHDMLATNGESRITLPGIPAGNPPPLSATELLNALFNTNNYRNVQFTPSQINTAISMGLIKYDSSTNTYTLTTNGQTYLNSKRAAFAAASAPPPSHN